MKTNKYLIALAASLLAIAGCSSKTQQSSQKSDDNGTEQIVFDSDSAYSFVGRQCAFGERVPNTEAHRQCGDWLAAKLRSYGAKVTEQSADLKAFDGTVLHARNIVGEFYPEKQKRVLLLAHWDARPWADHDPNPDNHTKPVMAANDGASGVGVILEFARLLQSHEPTVGIDVLFVDAEDWGNSDGDDEKSWALGAQYWVAHPHREGYKKPDYGILLDMVGDGNARFLVEYMSSCYAPDLVERIWNVANHLGYGKYFVKSIGGGVTDDHIFINGAGIPCVDIIDQRIDSETGFCPQWHTVDDTMDHIDRTTLKAVGQTLVSLLIEK